MHLSRALVLISHGFLVSRGASSHVLREGMNLGNWVNDLIGRLTLLTKAMEVGRPNELFWSICLGGRNLQNISDGDAVH